MSTFNKALRKAKAIWQIGLTPTNWLYELCAAIISKRSLYASAHKIPNPKGFNVQDFTVPSNASSHEISAILKVYGICVINDFIEPKILQTARVELVEDLVNRALSEKKLNSQEKHGETKDFVWQSDYSLCSSYLDMANHPKAYINIRSRDAKTDDAGMIDIFGIDKLIKVRNYQHCARLLDEINSSNALHATSNISGYPQRQSNLYINNAVTNTRGPHIDSNADTYKLFLYLSDVNQLADGPYCYLPKSHKSRSWMSYERLKNAVLGLPSTEVSSLTPESLIPLLGNAGTAIITCQSGIHCGWPQSDKGKRLMLVCNFF